MGSSKSIKETKFKMAAAPLPWILSEVKYDINNCFRDAILLLVYAKFCAVHAVATEL